MWAKVCNFVLGLGPRNWSFLLFLQCLVTKVSQYDANCHRLLYLQFFDPLSWRVSYIIYPLYLILAFHLLIMQVATRVLVPSAAFPNLL